MNICLNHRRMEFPFCKNCKGYDMDCPEYLIEEHTLKSPSVSRILEASETNGVRIVQSDSSLRTHSESYSHTRETDLELTGKKFVESRPETIYTPQVTENQNRMQKSSSHPVEFRRLTLLEATLTRRNFLERFRRYQR